MTVTLYCPIQYFAKQVGGGPKGFRGPLGDSIPTASPFSLSAPSVLTSLHHWPSSFGKLPRSASLTIRKCSKTGLFWLSFHSHLNIWRGTQTEYQQQQWCISVLFQTCCLKKSHIIACSNRWNQCVSFKRMQKLSFSCVMTTLSWMCAQITIMDLSHDTAELKFDPNFSFQNCLKGLFL